MNVNLKIVTFLLSLGMLAFAVILGVSIGSGNILLPSLVAGFFVALVLISRPQIAAFCAIITFSSGITIPGLPGQMRLFDAFAAALLAIFLLRTFMKTGDQTRFSRLDWIVVIFCGWIFFIGAYRGFGFLTFGGDMIGGFNYLRLLLSATLVITLPRIGLSPGKWKPALVLMGLLAPATLVADLLVVSGWDFGVVRLFVQTSGDVAAMAREAAGDDVNSLRRLWAAGPAANAMLLALLCMVPMRRFFQATGIFWLGAFAGIVTLSLLSGFRLMTANLIVIAVLTLYLQKAITTPRIAVLVIAACIGIFSVYLYSMDLPNSVQRAISWLPGIEISNIARGDAFQTVEWRLRLWRVALRDLPEYWLIGKGFSYNTLEAIAAFQAGLRDDLQWALVVGAYHNGWLSMLLGTGIIGTILCLILLIAPLREQWKVDRDDWNSAALKRYHGVFLAALIANAFVFLVIYGDVHASFPVLFFQWAMLKLIATTDTDSQPSSDLLEHETADYAESTYHGS